ncbi:MAG: sigma-E factor negative regulatory protein [Gammaproteobacteria bacterium]|nr:sigma-E factor negative regulatory protein [Gammaproteobacteria bacterium]
MSHKINEQVSAFMDGETDKDEFDALIKRLCHREAHDEQACWERFHLVRDALKKNLPDVMGHDLRQRVSSALKDEPSVLAPRRFHIDWGRFSKPLAGAAIAASVASVSIVGLRMMLPETASVATVASSPATPVVEENIARVTERPAAADESPNERAARLNGYLVNHSEFASPSGIQALPPYVRVVGQSQSGE